MHMRYLINDKCECFFNKGAMSIGKMNKNK